MAGVLDRLLAASFKWEEDPQVLLDEMERAAVSLKVKESDRSYRSSFSENYKALFAKNPRRYSSQVMEACEARGAPIVVNGVVYNLTPATAAKAAAVTQCLEGLLGMLRSWSSRSFLRRSPQVKPVLEQFDKAWALLEDSYVHELMAIEERARAPLASAIKLEKELRQLEKCYVSSPCQQRKQRRKLCLPAASASSGQRQSRLERQRETSDAQSPCARQRHLSGNPEARSPCSKQRQHSEADSECSSLFQVTIPGSPCSRQRQISTELPSISAASRLEETANSSGKATQSHIRHLAMSASSRCESERLREVLQELFAQVCTLNAYRGRGDMAFEVLEAAADAYLSSQHAAGSTCSSAVRSSQAAQQLLACTVLNSFADLREHFSEITNIMHIDPQLRNNATLMQRLAAFEESCELGARFLIKPELLAALCSVAAEAVDAQRLVPEFRALLEDQDAELFLILPRLVLLCGLEDPSHLALVESFLPHHFGSSAVDDQAENRTKQAPSEEMQRLQNHFERASEMLGTLGDRRKKTLVQRAVMGFQTQGHGHADEAVDDLMRRLEGFSMELQRHRPQDWNRCSSILLQCIEAASNVHVMSDCADDRIFRVSL